MPDVATKAEHRSMLSPDEIRNFDHGHADIVNMAGVEIGRLVLQKGWRWSQDVKPIAGTEWCEAPHFQYCVQGRLRVHMMDGTEFDIVPGDISAIPEGHDAWVLGDDPCILVDWWGASNYAKPTA